MKVVIPEVGEILTINDKRVKCVKNTGQGCKPCAFEFTCNKHNRPACYAYERPDRTVVHFVKV